MLMPIPLNQLNFLQAWHYCLVFTLLPNYFAGHFWTKTMTKALWKTLAITTIIWASVMTILNVLHSQELERLQTCEAEATAWYMSSTALSDAIVRAALNGFPAEKVDTNVATAFAVRGHELNCIRPKFPTG
jgi:hypothetical protein